MAEKFPPASPQSQRLMQRWVRVWHHWLHPASARLRRDPLARLSSVEEVPIAAALGIRIDVNQATVDDWLRLPGLSIHQARILTSLTQGGIQFHSVEDISAALGVPLHQLTPLKPLLQFCYYDPNSATAPGPVPLNEATLAQLMALPGMAVPLAERIVNERRRSPFRHWADVHHRLRLTPEQTARWMHYLRI